MFLRKIRARLFLYVMAVWAMVFAVADCSAQTTPDVPVRDTVIRKKVFEPNPKKAGLYSALIPGLGQVYNRQYWKVPIIYAGLGTATYFFIDNRNLYLSYRKAYIGRLGNSYPTDPYYMYDVNQLNQLQSDYARYMNLTVLFGSLGVAIQIIDAVASAHLKNFDISRDISFHMVPIPTPGGMGIGFAANYRIGR